MKKDAELLKISHELFWGGGYLGEIWPKVFFDFILVWVFFSVVTFHVTADSEFLATSGSSAQRVCFKDGDSCVTKTRGSFTIFKAPAEVTCPKSTLEVMVKDDWVRPHDPHDSHDLGEEKGGK